MSVSAFKMMPLQEYLLQGSLPEANKDNLLHRLNGLCDMNGQGPERFHDHEMVLQLSKCNQNCSKIGKCKTDSCGWVFQNRNRTDKSRSFRVCRFNSGHFVKVQVRKTERIRGGRSCVPSLDLDGCTVLVVHIHRTHRTWNSAQCSTGTTAGATTDGSSATNDAPCTSCSGTGTQRRTLVTPLSLFLSPTQRGDFLASCFCCDYQEKLAILMFRHLRYVGQLDVGDKSRHTHVRNCIDVGTTENVVQFLQDMGYRFVSSLLRRAFFLSLINVATSGWEKRTWISAQLHCTSLCICLRLPGNYGLPPTVKQSTVIVVAPDPLPALSKNTTEHGQPCVLRALVPQVQMT